MSNSLAGASVVFLTANEGVEQVELTEPWAAVERAGGSPVLVAPETGTVQGFKHLDRADTFEAEHAAGDVTAAGHAGLVLPGGVANADSLRMSEDAVALVESFFEAGKPVAVICHGSWVMIEAGVVSGRTMTSWPSLRTDLVNAGADWVDREVVVCEAGPGTIVSSRNPDDLPAFIDRMLAALGSAPGMAGGVDR